MSRYEIKEKIEYKDNIDDNNIQLLSTTNTVYKDQLLDAVESFESKRNVIKKKKKTKIELSLYDTELKNNLLLFKK